MDKEIKGLEERLQKVNLIISKLDPAIKVLAFELFKPIILGESKDLSNNINSNIDRKEVSQTVIGAGDVRDFFASFDPKKPADYTLVLAAWFYTQRGNSAFSLDELYGLFDEVGMDRPSAVNMTLRACSRKGKKLFTTAGHAKFRPNVNGENYFKSEMKLRPGKANA